MQSEEHDQLYALGYGSVRSPLLIDDPAFVRQEATIERFCRQRGWELVACLRDVEPRRTRTWRRPGLLCALDRISAGEATCLVGAELSRFCPSVAELGWILDAIEQANGRLVSLDPPLDTGVPVGRAVARALASVSGWERSRRSQITAAARRQDRVPGTMPPNLRRRIQRLRRTGLTLQAIADLLNAEGIPTVRGGARWRPSSVQAALGYRRPEPSAFTFAPEGSYRPRRRTVSGQLV